MRRLITGVLIPVALLTFAVYVRAENDGIHRWHPWELTWDIWLSSVVLTSMMVGAGLYAYWRMGGWRIDDRPMRRQRFDHDAVQLDADDTTQ